MKKQIQIFLIPAFFCLFAMGVQASFDDEYVKVIPRSEWGADESYRYLTSSYWKDILTKRAETKKVLEQQWNNYTKEQQQDIIDANALSEANTQKMNSYLSTNFLKDIQIVSTQKADGGNILAWPIEKTQFIKNIVIHHTADEYMSSASGIQEIYKYHALTRQWGDIGYHYIIGYNGEIFEGRAGGDYVVGAHDTWNNRSTVGISIMGDYDSKDISELQYQSLKKLIRFLTQKYGINLNTKIPYHRECKDCKAGLETSYYFPIVGHRDGKETSCPGEMVYTHTIPRLLKELQSETKSYNPVSFEDQNNEKKKIQKLLDGYNWDSLKKLFYALSLEKQKKLLQQVEEILHYEIGMKKKMFLQRFLEEID